MTRKKMIKMAFKHYSKYYQMPDVYVIGNSNYFYQCYASYAAKTIIDAIVELKNPENILDMLQESLEEYSDASVAANGDAAFMFSIAADVTTDFIDLYIFMKG